TSTLGARLIGGRDPAAQAHFAIDKIEGALQSLGGSLPDVVRTRVFVKNIADWEAVARVHGARFRDIRPANTLVEARLVGEDYLVEIEAGAELWGRGKRAGMAHDAIRFTRDDALFPKIAGGLWSSI